MNIAIKTNPPLRQQRGAATLIIVMVLLFVVTMVAAYTSRSLIFEQRTGVNQYRSTQAVEAAQAGLEWTKSLLNQGRINDYCLPSTNTGDTSFRQRYFDVAANGVITPKFHSVSGTIVPSNNLTPTCVYNGSGWNCTCPSSTAPGAVSGADMGPAFRVRIGANYSGYATAPTAVRIEVVGCTTNSDTCLSFIGQGQPGEGRAVVTELLMLTATLPSPPTAALTAGAAVNPSGAMTAINASATGNGVTVQAGGSFNATSMNLVSLPGNDPSASVLDNDDRLNGANSDLYFAGFFNMWPAQYKQAPGTLVLGAATSGCTVTGCSAAAVRSALSLNPGRVVWVEGDLEVDSTGDIGSATAPALLVLEGDLKFSNAVTIFGLVYVRNASWTATGTGTVRGALVAEGAVTGSGTPTLQYDSALLQALRLNRGTYALVPGGWKDYCSTEGGVQDAGNNLGC